MQIDYCITSWICKFYIFISQMLGNMSVKSKQYFTTASFYMCIKQISTYILLTFLGDTFKTVDTNFQNSCLIQKNKLENSCSTNLIQCSSIITIRGLFIFYNTKLSLYYFVDTQQKIINGQVRQVSLECIYVIIKKPVNNCNLVLNQKLIIECKEAVTSIGQQVDLPKSDVVFKGHIDSNWSVGAVLEKKLNPLPFTLALSGLMTHTKGQFRLGVGIIIG